MSRKAERQPVAVAPQGLLARPSGRRRLYALVLLIALVMAALVGLALHIRVQMTTRFVPLVDAARRIKLEVTTAHLWFEEILGGDKNEEIETVWRHLDAAEGHAVALLEGATNGEGLLVALETPQLRTAIKGVADELRAFRRVAEQRLAAAQRSRVGTPVEQQFDQIFRRVLARADDVEAALQKSIRASRRDSRRILTALIVACLLLGLATVWILRRYERRRSWAVARLKKSEQALGRLLGEQRFLLENMRDFVYRTGVDGSLDFVSSTVEQVTGYTPKEWPAVFARHGSEAPSKPGSQAYRLEIPSKQGARLTLEFSEQSFLEGEQPAGTIGVARDITRRVAAEEKRLDLERQGLHAQKLESLGVLAGGIAHDFNNLLVAILGNADMALQDVPPGSQAAESLKEIELASRRAAGLAKQMLAYSGKGRFVIEAIDLNALIAEMSQLLEVSVSTRTTIRTDLAEDLPAFKGDATQIQQVVMNLISNAAEACGEDGGQITLSTSSAHHTAIELKALGLDGRDGVLEALPAGDYITLMVADTGCGMDEGTAARLFEPFFTTKFSGRGLGMAAVQGIVRGHGGALLVETEPDRGTRIQVLLKAIEEAVPASKPAARRPAGSAPGAASYTGTVLVVDDSEAVRRVITWMLESLGLDVLEAASGAEAMERLRQCDGRVRCVFLDLSMPDKQGDEVFREMRAEYPGIQVVMCSGFDEQDATEGLVGSGLAAFLQKPFVLHDVKATLEAIIGGVADA